MRIRHEFTGMLPAAIEKFEKLLVDVDVAKLSPIVAKGYDSWAGLNSFFYWGAACQIQCAQMSQLKKKAKALGITWLSNDGDMAYISGLTILDFQTYRVNGALELTPEKEV